MKEKKAAPTVAKKKAAAATAAKRRKSGGADGGRPRKRARDDNGDSDPSIHGDINSNLPDAILGTIVSLLRTKDGARTQILARRWRPLWRSAPLNLDVDYHLCSSEFKRLSIASRILSDHPGPARRFVFHRIRLHKAKKRFAEDAAQIGSWFHSGALDNLQELDVSFWLFDTNKINFSKNRFQLPPSVLRCASSLVVARMRSCDFPKEIPPSLSFPLLKQLTLRRLSISEDVLHGVLSACHILESLYL
jgi:hypothetical protein